MFNLRTSGIIAGGAFAISFLISLVSGVSMPVLILRPLVFALVFFVIAFSIGILVARFLPELLDMDSTLEEPVPLSGSKVDITEGDGPPPSVRTFFGEQPDDSDDNLGNISDLLGASMPDAGVPEELSPAGMDQNPRDGYNENGGVEEFSEPEPPGKAAIPAAAGFSDSVDVLPDLESMAGAFSSSSAADEPDVADYFVPAPARKPMSSANKSPSWAGDFNAKEMASGLRTILNKEKEG